MPLIQNETCKTMLILDSLSEKLLLECKPYTKTLVKALNTVLATERQPTDVGEPLLHDGQRKSYTLSYENRTLINAMAEASDMRRDDWVNEHIHAVAPRLLREAHTSCIVIVGKNRTTISLEELPNHVARLSANRQSFYVKFL